MQAKEDMVQRGGFIAEVALGVRAICGNLTLVLMKLYCLKADFRCLKVCCTRVQNHLPCLSPLSQHTAHWIV